MSKPVLALDFDDLIYPFMFTLVPFHNERYGTQFTLQDFHTFDFEDVWGGTLEESIDKINQCFDSLERHPEPVAGAAHAIEELAKRFELVIVTARDDSLRGITEEYVALHFPTHFTGVYLCNSYAPDGHPNKRTKASVCEEINAIGLVDDSLTHVTEVAATGRFGILFGDYGWNQATELPEGVVRAQDWKDVLHRLNRLEELGSAS